MKRILLTAIVFSLLIPTSLFSATKIKSLGELIDASNSGWSTVTRMTNSSKNIVKILPKENERADKALFQSQLHTSSLIGAIIYGSGGILIDNGWVRILGSGCKDLNRSLPEWNAGKSFADAKEDGGYMLVADDVMGGFFAIKTDGADEADQCKVYYFGPNGLNWQPTGLNYTGFISYCFSGDIRDFYSDFRWKGWENDVQKISTNEVVTCYPLLWTREALQQKTNRKLTTVKNQWDMYHAQKQVCVRNPKKKK